MEFLEDCMPAGVGSKANDIWFLSSVALLDAILGYMYSTTSPTDFRYRFPGTF